MVALSDSSVTSGSSTATASPGLTWISITGTSLKSPMSGTWISISCSLLWMVLASSTGRSRRTSSSTWQRCRVNRAASAPSITRWS